jgi:hypothetical protein
VAPAAGAWADGTTAIFQVARRDAFHPHLTRLVRQVRG